MKLKFGVIGVGHLGKFHLEKLKFRDDIDLTGFYEKDKSRRAYIEKELEIPSFSNLNSLLENCNAVTIATPTLFHFEVAQLAMDMGCHVFIEKPITHTVEEADNLLHQAEKLNKFIQVGHIEQFNPALTAIDFSEINPMFIEAHRLSPFPGRGLDVPVVLDLMIHDIGIVLSIVHSEVKDIKAFGQSVVSDTTDLANARIEFENGCVVNLTTSRVSLKKMRKMRIFQHHRYLTIDFLNRIVDDYHSYDNEPKNHSKHPTYTIDGPRKKYIQYNNVEVEQTDALSTEFDHFINTIKTENNTGYSGEEATKALNLAIEIQNIIESN